MAVLQIVQHRRDSYANFAPSKLKPGEIVMVQSGDPNTSSGKGVYACIASGSVLQLATLDELGTYDDAAQAAATAAEGAKADVVALKDQINTDLSSAQAAVQSAVSTKTDIESIKSQVESIYSSVQSAAAAAQTAANDLRSYADTAQAAAQTAQSAETAIAGVKSQIDDDLDDFRADMAALKGQVDLELENAQAAADNAAETKEAVQGLKTQAESAVSSAQAAAQNAQTALAGVQAKSAEIEDLLNRRTREMDAGTGTTDAAGAAYVYLSEDFRAALETHSTYMVLLQEEGEGKVFVSEKTDAFFVVNGTADLSFSWLAII